MTTRQRTAMQQFEVDCRALYYQIINDSGAGGMHRDEAMDAAIKAVHQAIANNKITEPDDPLDEVIAHVLIRSDAAAPTAVSKYLRHPALGFPNDPIWSTPVRIDGRGLRKSLGECNTEDLDSRLQLIRDNRARVERKWQVEEELTTIRVGEMQRGGHETIRAALWANALSDFDDDLDDEDLS